MAEDARTEARRRIALATHRLVCSGCTDSGCIEMDESDWDIADAVLALFPTAFWEPAGSRRMLVLRSWPPEPVAEEPRP